MFRDYPSEEEILIAFIKIIFLCYAIYLGVGMAATDSIYGFKMWQRVLSNLDPSFHPIIAEYYRQVLGEILMAAGRVLLAASVAVMAAILLYGDVKIFDRF